MTTAPTRLWPSTDAGQRWTVVTSVDLTLHDVPPFGRLLEALARFLSSLPSIRAVRLSFPMVTFSAGELTSLVLAVVPRSLHEADLTLRECSAVGLVLLLCGLQTQALRVHIRRPLFTVDSVVSILETAGRPMARARAVGRQQSPAASRHGGHPSGAKSSRIRCTSLAAYVVCVVSLVQHRPCGMRNGSLIVQGRGGVCVTVVRDGWVTAVKADGAQKKNHIRCIRHVCRTHHMSIPDLIALVTNEKEALSA